MVQIVSHDWQKLHKTSRNSKINMCLIAYQNTYILSFPCTLGTVSQVSQSYLRHCLLVAHIAHLKLLNTQLSNFLSDVSFFRLFKRIVIVYMLILAFSQSRVCIIIFAKQLFIIIIF